MKRFLTASLGFLAAGAFVTLFWVWLLTDTHQVDAWLVTVLP